MHKKFTPAISLHECTDINPSSDWQQVALASPTDFVQRQQDDAAHNNSCFPTSNITPIFTHHHHPTQEPTLTREKSASWHIFGNNAAASANANSTRFRSFFKKRLMKKYRSAGKSDDDAEHDEHYYENYSREKDAMKHGDMEDDEQSAPRSYTSSSLHNTFSFCESNPGTHTENYEGDEEDEELEIDDGTAESYSSSEETEEGFIDKIRRERQKIAQWEQNTKEHMRQNLQQFSNKIQNQATVLSNKIQTAKQSVNSTNQQMRQMFQNIRLKQTEKVRKAVKDLENRFQNMPTSVQIHKKRSHITSDAMECDDEHETGQNSEQQQQAVPQLFTFGGNADAQKGTTPSTMPNKQRPFHFHWKPQFTFPKFWNDSSVNEEHQQPSEQEAQRSDATNPFTTTRDPKNPWFQPIKDQKWDFQIAAPPPPPVVQTSAVANKPATDFQFFAPPPPSQPINTAVKPNLSFFNNQIDFVFPAVPQQQVVAPNPFIITPPPSYQQCYPDGAPVGNIKKESSTAQPATQQNSFSQQFVQHAKNFALKHPLPSVPSFQFGKLVNNNNSLHRPVKYRKIYPSNQPSTPTRVSTSSTEITSPSSSSTTQHFTRPFGLRKKSKTRMSLSAKKGIWSKDEHAAFENAYRKFGKQWSKIATLVPSRNKRQIMSHAQKYDEQQRKSKEAT